MISTAQILSSAPSHTLMSSGQSSSDSRTRRQPCHFFNTPRGCREGDRCRFEHIASSNQSALQNQATPRQSTSPTSPQAPRYPRNSNTNQRAASTSQAAAVNTIAPFLTGQGLSKVSQLGAGTDDFFVQTSDTLSPGQAQHFLKKFLQPDFRFTKTLDIYSFLKIINNATANNSSWTGEDGQLMLKSIASGTGLLRVGDIIRWEQVTPQAGASRQILSFQRGYIPLLRYFSSEFVIKSTLSSLINGLYQIIVSENFDKFSSTVETCMESIMKSETFKDTQINDSMLGIQCFSSLAVVFYELLTRFKNIVAIQSRIPILVHKLQDWLSTWIDGILSSPSRFDNPFANSSVETRDNVITRLKQKIERLVLIVDREDTRLAKQLKTSDNHASNGGFRSQDGLIAALERSYDGPGEDRAEGPRHDNDFIRIDEIHVAPTNEELMCRIPPFLPANIPGAPHPLASDSMERLLDIQFRLLREEMIASIRTAVQFIVDDMSTPIKPGRHGQENQLNKLIQNNGGKYRGVGDNNDNIIFNVYTHVGFTSIVPGRRGVCVGLKVDTPPGRARSSQVGVRTNFWKGIGGKRLMQGGLVALIWKHGVDISVYLALLSTPSHEIVGSARQPAGAQQIDVQMVFFDPAVELRILDALRHPENDRGSVRVVVESSVLYDTIRPFLEALRVVPETLPFSRYLAHQPQGSLETIGIHPPAYARVPGFEYDLSCLRLDGDGSGDELWKLNVSNPVSVASARERLKAGSKLDLSQADAVVDALTRELTLIQGPPGTGKSYTGIRLLNVLISSGIRPILMIAYTNHALDHMLTSVLDAGITKNITRLGSKHAMDERLQDYSIETMELAEGRSRLDRAFAGNYRQLKIVEEEFRNLMKRIAKVAVDTSQILSYIEHTHLGHFWHLEEPPEWISIVRALNTDGDNGEWHIAGQRKAYILDDGSMYTFWLHGRDISFLSGLLAPKPRPSPLQTGLSQLATEQSDPENISSLHNRFEILPVSSVTQGSSDDSEDSDDIDDEDFDETLLPFEQAWKVIPVPDFVVKTENNPPKPMASEAPLTQVHVEPLPDLGGSADIAPKDANDKLDIHDINDPDSFFREHGSPEGTPKIPQSDRPLENLLELDDNLWSMSMSERYRLHVYWEQETRAIERETQLEEFKRLRERHEEASKVWKEGQDERKRQLLRRVDIIGCTTNGAAKLTSLLRSLEPRAILVEEAGQVLEAHILGNLVPSIEHCILIGDPLQLRANINTYALSMDNRRGKELYRFDVSLMERLSGSGLPMSQIQVQRRMRPQISNLIRTTLYPRLEDHELVTKYPPVRGFTKNVYFLNHDHAEGGKEEESSSKYNVYEVEMIKDLVVYLLRQGCYSKDGDIVVLCAYLGQLARVRDALSSIVTVVIDDRDAQELADREEELEETVTVEHVSVSRKVLLRTVDNFQGEEAAIVVLSLVRNSGKIGSELNVLGQMTPRRSNIGFLKSENRTNVAISRAKEGLFILGNANDLSSRSNMWGSIIEQLESEDAIGNAIPVACHRHPETLMLISEPGVLPMFSPDGGCLQSCDMRLKCGHNCPYKCHPDDPHHVSVKCMQPCTRLCPRNHPCNKECSAACGDCRFPISGVILPCRHEATVSCYMIDSLEEVKCDNVVVKQLPGCEHSARLACQRNPNSYACRETCGKIMSCCGKICTALCYQCQNLNSPAEENHRVLRREHRAHPCQRRLYCEHQCQEVCSEDHHCTTMCKAPCLQVCAHSACKSYCGIPCAPCAEPCTWNCQHYQCPVPCGSVCARLPCDLRCEKTLSCGHRCPSVCGEDCNVQICPACANDAKKLSVVDFVMQRTLNEVDPSQETLDELLITLPKCGHVFTVETLDGICGLRDWYECDDQNRWVRLTSPTISSEVRKPPTCPTCRASITSPRYGRSFKPANLHILERNTASRLSQSLAKLYDNIEAISEESIRTGLERAAQTVNPDQLPDDRQKRRSMKNRVSIFAAQDKVANIASTQATNPNFHSLISYAAKAWVLEITPLTIAYTQAAKLAASKSSHTAAWEAAFSYIYHQEMDLILSDPSHAPHRPHEHSLRMARIKVGQLQPQADHKYVIESLWLTLQIRFTMIRLAQSWLEALRRRDSGYPESDRLAWAEYIDFLLRTCSHDAQITLRIAQRSGSHKQAVQSLSFVLRAEFELSEFNVAMSYKMGVVDDRLKETFIQQTRQACDNAKALVQSILEPVLILQRDQTENALWMDLRSQAMDVLGKIQEGYRKMESEIVSGALSPGLSLEELTVVVRSFGFSHTGHFYNCPNGHIFVIGECGGAMEVSTCPECGATIGGSNHSLIEGNTRNTQLDDIARRGGAETSPWPWAR